jgi:putative spermidine/putrescine transport system permease protein
MTRMHPLLRWLGATVVISAYLLMLGPISVVIIESFSDSEVMRFPPTGLSLRWFHALAGNADFLSSFRVSLILATVASVISTAAGTLAAYALVRHRRARQASIESLLLAPLYVPRVLLGMALLLTLSKVSLAGSLLGMVLGHVLITMPFVVRTVTASLAGIDPAIEEAARSLGATWREMFLKVTVPMIRSGVIAGAVFAFIISFSDVYLALFIAGPATITLPLRIFNYMEWEQTPLIAAVSTVQIALILVVMIIAEKAVGLSGAGRL